MANPTAPKNNLPKTELIIIGSLLVIFFVWSFQKCRSNRAELVQTETNHAQQQAAEDSLYGEQKPKPKNPKPAATVTDDAPKPAEEPKTSAEASSPKNAGSTKLYVVIEGLKVRKEPDMKAEVITELKLFEQVGFTGKSTDYTTKLNLGKMEVNEPWVQIITPKGSKGWVYGAGVNYLKRKHPGTF